MNYIPSSVFMESPSAQFVTIQRFFLSKSLDSGFEAGATVYPVNSMSGGGLFEREGDASAANMIEVDSFSQGQASDWPLAPRMTG